MHRTISDIQATRRVTLRGLAVAATVIATAASFAPGKASAQQYPAKNITALVPFAAGGGADTQTRIWGAAIAPIIGRRIIVENNGAAAAFPPPSKASPPIPMATRC